MRNMSFAMTTEQIRLGCKDVTRRFGWWFLKPGDLVSPVKKGMGLKKGETVKKIRGPIRIVSVRSEQLISINDVDVLREGFAVWTPAQYVEMMCKHYRCDPSEPVNRIEFTYTDSPHTNKAFISTNESAARAAEFCKCHPGWQRICDIDDSFNLYLSFEEIPKEERKFWKHAHGEYAADAWAEFGVGKCRFPTGYISGTGLFYSHNHHIPKFHNSMMVIKTG